jgi:hypothetical protein
MPISNAKSADAFKRGFVSAYTAASELFAGNRLGSIYGMNLADAPSLPAWVGPLRQRLLGNRPKVNEAAFTEGVAAGLVAAELATKRAEKALESALAGETTKMEA